MATTNQTFRELKACCWDATARSRGETAALLEAVEVAHGRDVVVSSCQRIEAYSAGDCGCRPDSQLGGRDSVIHLTEVAAGLHSVVLGEAQILGQVRQAFAASNGRLRAGGDFAIQTARQFRKSVQFDSHAGHLLDKALRVAGEAPGGRLLVLGTGAMGKLVADRGREIGFDEVIIAGRRQPERGAAAHAFVPLDKATGVGRVDVVAGCLGSGAAAIPTDTFDFARKLIADLGTPANFEGEAEVPVVTIADLIHDESTRPHAVRKRTRLREQLHAMLPTVDDASSSGIREVWRASEAAQRREVERMARLHPELPREALEQFARSLMNQFLHAPLQRVREAADGDLAVRFAELFAEQ